MRCMGHFTVWVLSQDKLAWVCRLERDRETERDRDGGVERKERAI